MSSAHLAYDRPENSGQPKRSSQSFSRFRAPSAFSSRYSRLLYSTARPLSVQPQPLSLSVCYWPPSLAIFVAADDDASSKLVLVQWVCRWASTLRRPTHEDLLRDTGPTAWL